MLHSTESDYNLLVICGPTASGKTSLAVALAAQFGGEIISADSRQVYRGLDIGSGKDLHEYTLENSTILHHLIDIINPEEVYTLYHFQQDFYKVFDDVTTRKKKPILCGGSGLYIEAVLRGYTIPLVPENSELRLQLMEKPFDDLVSMLLTLNPDLYHKTDRSSKKRVVRSIEIALHKENVSPPKSSVGAPEIRPLILCTRWDRSVLINRIDKRLHERLSQGMVDEVRRLRVAGISDERLTLLGMEYKFITRYLRDELDYNAMVEQLGHSIHRLAKRQVTWFRGMERRGSVMHWVDDACIDTAKSLVQKHFHLN